MTVVRSCTIIVAMLAAVGCGDPAAVTGPSQSAFGQAGAAAPGLVGANAAPSGITNATRGSTPAATGAASPSTAAAAASNAASPIVAMSMPVVKPAAAPAGGAAPGTPGAPGAAPAGAPGAPGTAPGAGAPGAGVPGAPGGAAQPATMAGPPGEPVIPEVKGECPEFRSSTITYMGLRGINVVAGAKGSGEKKAPFVFYWHGTGSFAAEYASMAAAVSSGVTQEGGILVSFEGSTGGDLLSGTSVFGMGDFEITDQLLACGVKNFNIDPKQVFSTGCSAGGLFAGAMGAARSNYMAAVAPNSGGWTVPVPFQNMWTPALMTVHGAPGGDVVIVDFSMTSMTADAAYKQRGGFVVNCNHGGGHCGGGGLAGNMWEFFKAHPYGTNPSPWKDALPSGFNKACELK